MTKEEFLKDVQGWDNHRYLLWPALEATKGDVVEMGMGSGSTPFLHEYCTDRRLFSYDNNAEWLNNFVNLRSGMHQISFISDWDNVSKQHPKVDVLLIDHAPGERRHIDVQLFANKAKIIVIHDSEPAATGYLMDRIWPLFKYRKDHESPGAWATAVSNFIDVSKW